MIRKDYLKVLKSRNVNILDIKSVYIDESSEIGYNVTIYPNNVITKNSIIGDNCIIEGNNHIENCIIGKNNKISNSYLKDTKLKDNNIIGPYDRLRNVNLESNIKLGNFVEISESKIKENVKIKNLSNINNAEIGENTKIGYGVIFCNDNEKDDLKIIVGKNCFLGSNCNIISPIIIGDNTFIASGCTIYKNIENDKFVISNRELNIREDYKKIHLKLKDDVKQ